jgi:hypothetical protein
MVTLPPLAPTTSSSSCSSTSFLAHGTLTFVCSHHRRAGDVPLVPLLHNGYGASSLTNTPSSQLPSATPSTASGTPSAASVTAGSHKKNPVVVVDGAVWQLQREPLGISRVWSDLLEVLVPRLLR